MKRDNFPIPGIQVPPHCKQHGRCHSLCLSVPAQIDQVHRGRLSVRGPLGQ